MSERVRVRERLTVSCIYDCQWEKRSIVYYHKRPFDNKSLSIVVK